MGAIGLLTMWMSKKRQDAAASAETEAATKSWADALDESKGAITRAVREKAANEAADKKLITGFEKLGVASNQVVDGVLGQGDALATLRGAAQGLPGVRWVDRTADFSQLLGHYRKLMGGLLLVGIVLVFGALWLRYRRQAWRVFAPTLIAGALTLGLLGL
ncbi:hypothetical protein, partial [Rhizobium sp. 18055]|uniref:hypothetical protein n=1 Tax=Rhizobium sp. 18055 TaxID=2681403 RepID=UPI00190F692D